MLNIHMNNDKLKKKNDLICRVIISIVFMILIVTYIFLSVGNSTYRCYESKINDGFQVKTGWELIKMRFEGNCDYEEIIKIDNNMSEKGDY